MLHVHRSERADGLVDALGNILASPLEDALATEIVSVPTRGVERWLAQSLAGRLGANAERRDGICANVDFPPPASLVWGAVAVASGIDSELDPWRPERALWSLLDVVDGCLSEPWLAALAGHLDAASAELGREPSEKGRAAGSRARRLATTSHLAGVFESYGVSRPEMVCGWAAGNDTSEDGRALKPKDAWQAELWRRLRDRIGVPSPAERLAGACERLVAEPELLDLPERVSLFGLTRMPPSHLQVLRALATRREVHLFLLHPSPELWARVAGSGPRPSVRRSQSSSVTGSDGDRAAARNPLLSSWGRDAREMQLVLGAAGAETADHYCGPRAPSPTPATLLTRIQSDVISDRPPPGVSSTEDAGADADRRALLSPDDNSIQIHSCHGLARQVEVLREAILHLLAGDPTLEPRDVIVMCPDIETFAPLIHASFGTGAGTGEPVGARPAGPDLRVRLADRSLRRTNPVLGVAGDLVDLAASRVTAAQVLDLASREPVRHRFGFDDDDLTRMEEWATATGVRWGLDAAHREPYRLQWLDANTWHSGLDRILVGVAMDEKHRTGATQLPIRLSSGPSSGSGLVGGVLPYDDIGSGDIELAGRLAELIDRLGAAVDDLTRPQRVAGWTAALAEGVSSISSCPDAAAWQQIELRQTLDAIVAEAQGSTTEITLAEMRSLLADRLRGRPTTANFRTGHLTACTLVPMRSVPHRVVCLLGLDDGVYPRATARDGDDIILDDPHVGDRDARSEDRQLLLDALMAATDKLVITYCGRDERTNAELPPAVPVGELLEVIDRTVRLPGIAPRAAREQVVVQHPLQPFDVRNFTPAALVDRSSWSFDPVSLRGAKALAAGRSAPPPFLSGPLPAERRDLIEVDQLIRFVQHPVRAFLRERLGLSLADRSSDLDDAVPIELDALERWEICQRLVDARLAGVSSEACLQAEAARGLLPPGGLAGPVIERLMETVDEVVGAAHDLGLATPTTSMEVNVALPGARTLAGSVAGVTGPMLTHVTYSRLAPKHRLAAWVRFLALSAGHPEVAFESVTLGRRRNDAAVKFHVSVSRISSLDGDPQKRRDLAVEQLTQLVDLFDRGMREPLPIYCATSSAYTAAYTTGKDAVAIAAKEWTSEYERPHEDSEPEHLLVLGGRVPFTTLVRAAARPEEFGAGWPIDTGTSSRFALYALRLWSGLASSESLVDR